MQEAFRSLRVPFFTVFFIFAIIYIFSYLFGPLPLSVNSVTTNKSDLFTVEGSGEASGIPDTALISLGVTKEAATVEQAQEQVNSSVNKITQDLKNLGVEVKNIKTTNYSVNPNYDFTNNRQTINGYSVSQNMEVRLTPIDQANKAIDVATAGGANNVSGVTFVLADDTRMKLEEDARKQAVEKAKAKASQTAKLAGIRLGKIINVYESSGSLPPQPMFAQDAKLSVERAVGGEPTQVTPGENTVRISISLSYQTL